MIKFSKDKQRRLNSDKVRAVNQLTTAKQTLINGDESGKQTIKRLEHKIQSMNYIQQQSWQIRSRAKWLEEGEKPTKYFFKLHASRTQKNFVVSVFDVTGSEVSSQQDIE